MSNDPSFLPEDYLAQKAERRTNLISLVLFGVVMLGVGLAFVYTNQKLSQVKRQQSDINARYQQTADQIRQVTELEEQRDQMFETAGLAASLVERVPRSILLAELINRMPDRLSLLEFTLTSEKIKPAIQRNQTKDAGQTRLGPARAQTKEEAAEEKKKILPPKYKIMIKLVGVAPTDLEVSRYLAGLTGYPLLQSVNLEYSKEKDIEGQTMREFEIHMILDPDADIRTVDPLVMPRRVRDPLNDTPNILGPGGSSSTVMVPTEDGEDAQ